MKAFNGLWPCLKMGGIYVIEDLHYQYRDKDARVDDAGLGHPRNVMEKFKNVAESLNRHSVGVANVMKLFPGDELVCQLKFGMNVLAVHKCTAEQIEHQKVADVWSRAKGRIGGVNTRKIANSFAKLRKEW